MRRIADNESDLGGPSEHPLLVAVGGVGSPICDKLLASFLAIQHDVAALRSGFDGLPNFARLDDLIAWQGAAVGAPVRDLRAFAYGARPIAILTV